MAVALPVLVDVEEEEEVAVPLSVLVEVDVEVDVAVLVPVLVEVSELGGSIQVWIMKYPGV